MAHAKRSEPAKRSQVVLTHVAPLLILLVLVLGLAALYWLMPGLGGRQLDALQQPGVGKTLEYLRLQPLTGQGQPVSLDDLKGRVALLNFWGTWCPPCRRELPHMADLADRFAGQRDFILLAVSCPMAGGEDDLESLREETAGMLKELRLDLPAYYDPDSATQRELGRAIDFRYFPTTVLLDRGGVIRAVWVGYRPGLETEMERYISMTLDKEGPPPGKQQGDTRP